MRGAARYCGNVLLAAFGLRWQQQLLWAKRKQLTVIGEREKREKNREEERIEKNREELKQIRRNEESK